MRPNAYLEHDPKAILQKILDYCQVKKIRCQFRKNAHRIKLEVPTSDQQYFVGFWIIFEKGRKKSSKGLYVLSFQIDNEDDYEATAIDQEFLCTGFLNLVKDLASEVGNPLMSLIIENSRMELK